MPYTPFHYGPGAVLGLLCSRHLNLAAVLIAGVIIDIEPIYIYKQQLNYAHHAFFHTLWGATIAAVILSGILYYFRLAIHKILNIILLPQPMTYRSILLGALAGFFLHIFFDSFVHADIKPFFPFSYNPFYQAATYAQVIFVCQLAFALAGLLYLLKLNKKES